MFLYAWLVDRFSPMPKQGAVDLAQVNFTKTYRELPRTTVDLGERKDWVVEPPRHADLALLYLSLDTGGTNGSCCRRSLGRGGCEQRGGRRRV